MERRSAARNPRKRRGSKSSPEIYAIVPPYGVKIAQIVIVSICRSPHMLWYAPYCTIERAADCANKRDIVLSPLPGLHISCSVILGLRAAPQRSTPGYCPYGASGAEQIDFFSRPQRTQRKSYSLRSLRSLRLSGEKRTVRYKELRSVQDLLFKISPFCR